MDARALSNDFALSSPSFTVRNVDALAVEKSKQGLAVPNLARAPLDVGSPEPVTPEIITPDPATPEPVTPEPVTPEPVTPDPASSEPEPAKPQVVKPTPKKPTPATPDGGQSNDEGSDGAASCSAKRGIIQARSDFLVVRLYRRTAKALRTWLKKTTKSKSRRANSPASSDSTPPFPTKDEIKANWKSNPKFDASKLFFYSSPPGADAAQSYADEHYPGYLTMLSSFIPEEWADDWALYPDDESVKRAFWVLASEAFAEVATGRVYAFLPDGEGNDNTWDSPTKEDKSLWNDELKILQASDAVTSIVRINENPPNAESAMKGSC